MKYILILLLISIVFAYTDTNELSGKIIDADSREPIEFVNVYLSNTTIGTTTDSDGFFRIKNIPPGDYEVLITFVGYETFRFSLAAKPNIALNKQILLKKKTIELDEIQITAEIPEKWKTQYKIFKECFLGCTENSENCIILNPGVIEFSESKGILSAHSTEIIKIKNYMLGYNISISLDNFSYTDASKTILIKYYPFFSEMDTSDTEIKENWIVNRKKAYMGSPRHFFKSLVTSSLLDEGFQVYAIETNKPLQIQNTFFTKSQEFTELWQKSAVKKEGNNLYNIHSTIDNLYVLYLNEQNENGYFPFALNYYYPVLNSNYQLSIIRFSSYFNIVNQDGAPYYSDYSITKGGYWAYERLAETLPNNYTPD